jgi:hypothetical protein
MMMRGIAEEQIAFIELGAQALKSQLGHPAGPASPSAWVASTVTRLIMSLGNPARVPSEQKSRGGHWPCSTTKRSSSCHAVQAHLRRVPRRLPSLPRAPRDFDVTAGYRRDRPSSR